MTRELRMVMAYSSTPGRGAGAGRKIAPSDHVTADGAKTLCGLDVAAVATGKSAVVTIHRVGCSRCWKATGLAA